MSLRSIQKNIKQNTKDFSKNSFWVGGLDITSKNIDQLDPLRGNFTRIFIIRLPRFMELMDQAAAKRFKHIVEMGCVGLDGIANTTMDTEELTGGYAGNRFKVPNVVKDETDSITIKLYELSGSPVREFTDTWMTGIADPLTGLSHYHGLISDECQFKASNHVMEMIVVATDPTGREDGVEYVCMLANMMPTDIKKDHFNFEPGTHPVVQVDIPFTATRYESPQINEIGKALLAKYKILRDYLNFNSGYKTSDIEAMDGYDPSLSEGWTGA